MLYFTRYLSSVFFLWHIAATNGLDSKRELHTAFPERQLPKLTAVTARADIHKRWEGFIPKQEYEHHYADSVSVLNRGKSRFAITSMKYKLPALILEDIEMNVGEIQCSGSAITVEFADQETLKIARKSWDDISEFLIISSHAGCNENGERAPHLISTITYGEDVPIVTFSVQRIEWSDAYNSMTVSFGTSESKYRPDSLRLHDGLRRRQAVPSSVSYPSAPTPTPSANFSVDNISYQVPVGEKIFSFSQENDLVQETVTVSCQNCSIVGTVEITEGVFSVNSTTIEALQAVNFIENGYFKAVANGVNAHIELDTTLSLSNTQSFDNTLSTITLPGFQIPGIAAVGPMFQLHLTGSIEIIAELDFTYGFDLIIPDNASIQLNIGNLSDSTSSGFTDAQITGIPFAASSPDISLILGLGLTAYILLGIDILSGDGEMTVGMFVDTPYLTLSVSQLAGVNAECEPVTDSSTINGFLSHIFPNLTHVVPQVGVDLGLTAGVELNVDESFIHTSFGHQDTLTQKSWALPTTCLLWDDSKKEFTSPTVTSSTTVSTTTGSTPTTTGKGGKAISNMGVRGTDSPISELGALWWSLGMLLSTLFIALCL